MLQISRQTASFLGGIYSEGSDRSYLEAGCYEFSPTDKKTKRSSRAAPAWAQPQAFISGMSWPPDLALDNCHINRALGEGSHFLPLPPPHPLLFISLTPLLHYLVDPLSRWLHPHATTCHNLLSHSLPPSHPSAERVRNDSSWPASLFPDSSSLVRRAE